MSKEDKPAYWQQHFDNWKKSGLSQRDYCKRINQENKPGQSPFENAAILS